MLILGSQLLQTPWGRKLLKNLLWRGDLHEYEEVTGLAPMTTLFQGCWPLKGSLGDFLGCLFPPATRRLPSAHPFHVAPPKPSWIKGNWLIQSVPKCQTEFIWRLAEKFKSMFIFLKSQFAIPQTEESHSRIFEEAQWMKELFIH